MSCETEAAIFVLGNCLLYIGVGCAYIVHDVLAESDGFLFGREFSFVHDPVAKLDPLFAQFLSRYPERELIDDVVRPQLALRLIADALPDFLEFTIWTDFVCEHFGDEFHVTFQGGVEGADRLAIVAVVDAVDRLLEQQLVELVLQDGTIEVSVRASELVEWPFIEFNLGVFARQMICGARGAFHRVRV